MQPEQVKELWEIRFQKILKGEKEAIIFYKDLLEKNQPLLEGLWIQDMLEQIMHDEAKHAQIAHELLSIVQRKKIKKRSKSL